MRLFLLFLFLLPAKFGYAFEVNVSESNLTRFQFGYLIGDLTVGDSAYVNANHFCIKNGNLYLVKNANVNAVSEYSANLKATLIPANKVLITLHPPKLDEQFTESNLKRPYLVTPGRELCSTIQTWFEEKLGLLEVESIEGFTDMLSYINHLKSLGFKHEP